MGSGIMWKMEDVLAKIKLLINLCADKFSEYGGRLS